MVNPHRYPICGHGMEASGNLYPADAFTDILKKQLFVMKSGAWPAASSGTNTFTVEIGPSMKTYSKIPFTDLT